MAARKPWRDLSPAYRRRMEKHGLNSRNWGTKRGDALRTVARGHGATPERPERAAKHPDKYSRYVQRRTDESIALWAKKQLLFSDRVKWRPRRAEEATRVNPQTNRPPRKKYVRLFLDMKPGMVDEIDWSDDEWGFLFYH